MSEPSTESPLIAVDVVIFRVINRALHVLLIKRPIDPAEGKWALPGAILKQGKTTVEACRDTLHHEANISIDALDFFEQLYTFDTKKGERAVTVAYMGLASTTDLSKRNEYSPSFIRLDALPELAFHHGNIVKYAHVRLCSKLSYTTSAHALLPREFTLTQLQEVYEAVFEKQLDKRNFRRKLLSLDIVEETDKTLKAGAYRPAQLYRFISTDSSKMLDRGFDL